MVAVSGSPTEPEVIDRRRIQIAPATIAGSVQPYHTARGLGIAKARKFLDRARMAACEIAVAELRKAMNDLRGRAVACGILMGSGKIPGLSRQRSRPTRQFTRRKESFSGKPL
jgi:hypothetical protein